LAGALAAAVLLAGCTAGTPRRFTDRADVLCGRVVRSLDRLAPAASGTPALVWASERHTYLEHLVAQLTDDSAIPGGTAGQDVRDRWLRPARASLVQGLVDLETLRQAIRHGTPAQVTAALGAALRGGSAGVDTGYLHSSGMASCATVFTAPTPP
jgi:predicted acylesterase/phospholipase RssA